MEEAWQDAVRAGGRVGRVIEAHETIGSTNDRARELLGESDGDGRVVVAEEQSLGRGRRGRAWLSPPGRNLTVSVALRPRLASADAWRLGLASALAAMNACRRHAEVSLKWPNDIVADDGRKLGGLLVETMAGGAALAGAVIGIGINVNWPRSAMPHEIAAFATSLAELAGTPIDRVALLRALLGELEGELSAVEAGESPLDRYRAACSTLGTAVTVITPHGSIRGDAVDLDGTGSLVVLADGTRHLLSTGEIVRLERSVPA